MVWLHSGESEWVLLLWTKYTRVMGERMGGGGSYVSVRPLILLSPSSRDDTQTK